MDHKARAQRRKEIAEFIQKTNDIHKAATEFGVSVNTVYMACKENGIAPRKHQRIRQLEIVASLMKDGARQIDIAEQHGVSKQYINQVYKECKRLGIL